MNNLPPPIHTLPPRPQMLPKTSRDQFQKRYDSGSPSAVLSGPFLPMSPMTPSYSSDRHYQPSQPSRGSFSRDIADRPRSPRTNYYSERRHKFASSSREYDNQQSRDYPVASGSSSRYYSPRTNDDETSGKGPQERSFHPSDSWKRTHDEPRSHNHHDDDAYRPSKDYGGSNTVRGGPRPSALGNYKLKERQASGHSYSGSYDSQNRRQYFRQSESRSRSRSHTRSRGRRTRSRSRSRSRSHSRSGSRPYYSRSRTRSRSRSSSMSSASSRDDRKHRRESRNTRNLLLPPQRLQRIVNQPRMMPKNYKSSSQTQRRRSSTASSQSSRTDSVASSASSSRTPSPPPEKTVMEEPENGSAIQASIIPNGSTRLGPGKVATESTTAVSLPDKVQKVDQVAAKPIAFAFPDKPKAVLPKVSTPTLVESKKVTDEEFQVPGLENPPETVPGLEAVIVDPSTLDIAPKSPSKTESNAPIPTSGPVDVLPPPSVDTSLNSQQTESRVDERLENKSASTIVKSKEQLTVQVASTSSITADVAMTSPVQIVDSQEVDIMSVDVEKRPRDEDHQEERRNRPFRSRLPKHELIQPADNVTDALRICIAARRHADQESREDRVGRVLAANNTLVDLPHPKANYTTSINLINVNAMLAEKCSVDNPVRQAAVKMVAARETALVEKTNSLRSEYMQLHKKWLNHCKRLDSAIKESKASKPAQEELLTPATRTTRRSAAALGDAVRSDLEMEQIIASLGNDDLTDPNILASRNLAKIPDMISVMDRDKVLKFDDTTGLVRNPQKFYDVRGSIEDWSEDEKKTFVRKYALYPKQFGLIASFLEHKTTQDCILFYYVHKKELIDFRDAVTRWGSGRKRRGGGGRKPGAGRQKGNALLADIASTRPRRKQTVNDDSAQLPASLLDDDAPRPRRRERAKNREKDEIDAARSAVRHAEAAENESRRAGRRRTTLTRIVVPEEDEAEESSPRKPGRKPKKSKDDDAIRGRRPVSSSNWSENDKTEFLRLLPLYGNNFKRMSASMPNKTAIQLGNYYKYYCDELGLEAIAAKALNRSPTPEPAPPLSVPVPVQQHANNSVPVVTYQMHNYYDPTMSVNGPQHATYAQWAGQTRSTWSSMHTGPLPDVNPNLAAFIGAAAAV